MSDAGPTLSDLELATTWFLAARAMYAARGPAPEVAPNEASAGLYAQTVLGLSEEACLEATNAGHIGARSLVDCLGVVDRLPHEIAEKIVSGVMMLAYRDGRMHPLEVRWASMLASAARFSTEDFQRCCASARAIAALLRPGAEALP
jgi:hypothetical protein